ncbi:unnamed protein product [Rotaria socialis]|nr:unnamed protein product [Rotaria socialis]
MNEALRIRNTDLTFRFRTVIRDIYEQLLTHQCHERVAVYRGQMLSRIEYQKLRKSTRSLISLNSFLSTSINRKIAAQFVSQILNLCASRNSISVIFEIEADSAVVRLVNGENQRPFAQIYEFSYYGQEAEVLFVLGPIFRLNEIYDGHSSADAPIPIIRMIFCSDHMITISSYCMIT